MATYITREDYEKRKKDQKGIFLSRVFAHSGDADERILLQEAEEKFEREYPPYRNNNDL